MLSSVSVRTSRKLEITVYSMCHNTSDKGSDVAVLFGNMENLNVGLKVKYNYFCKI